MASEEELTFNEPHKPTALAKEAFGVVVHQIREELIKSRHNWDKHEPKMWSRVHGLPDSVFRDVTEDDLVLVSSAPTAYGTIILGKIRIKLHGDEFGYVHVRIHDPPNKGDQDVVFHSIFHYEGDRDADGHPRTWRAIQDLDTPLTFFND